MAPARLIGRWTMTALVLNAMIGSGIFGVPSELIKLLGKASPLAMILAAVAMAVIVLPIAEVSSQFSEPGGMYLYARRAFGRFAGLQIGWFWLLAIVGGGAAGTNLFLTYLGAFFPTITHGLPHILAILCLVGVPTVVNYVGVRDGMLLSVTLTVVKLLPIALVVALACFHSVSPGIAAGTTLDLHANLKAWLTALLLLTFSYSGFEDTLVPSGEVKQPRLTIPFGIVAGLLLCCVVYTALQWAIVSTVGPIVTDRPLFDAASILLGSRGASFVAIMVMFSTYGWISGAFFNAPRFAVSLAVEGDAPSSLGKLHPRYQTPTAGILLFAFAVCFLAITGTFVWAIALTAGSAMIIYAGTCAALIRLRRIRPAASALRIPFGPVLAVAGISICGVLLSQVDAWHLALMLLTSLIASINWLWARYRSKSLANLAAIGDRSDAADSAL
jgi:amino acid transporter